MANQEFDYHFFEVFCPDLKIIFITDETTKVAENSDVHMHAFWEIFYVKKGVLSVYTDDRTFRLEQDDVLLIPPNAYHSTKIDADTIKCSGFLAFERTKEAGAEDIFGKLHAAFSKCGIYQIRDAYIGHLLENLLEHHVTDRLGKRWRIKAGITELTFYLYDRMQKENLFSTENPQKHHTYWVYKYAIDRLLDDHYTEDISLEKLSELLSVSPQNITRIISLAYGKSFSDLKRELKMRNAKKLLRETNLSVSEIGEKIGYTSSRGFLAAFLKYEKCTPSEYRNKKK